MLQWERNLLKLLLYTKLESPVAFLGEAQLCGEIKSWIFHITFTLVLGKGEIDLEGREYLFQNLICKATWEAFSAEEEDGK